ncbi:PREDICTED: mitogen-activated protein kinase kinase kinase YODA isoform X1 [Camelina sativa]|uniref:mitogen-activated protein kinase kinase kinase n=1 Tax=Camelina sativa TaxID=90675 RepID=A0ABM0XE50_CAMSA|nr:PREDICTED: mitogen-activated protein kinase kinase kinase YODA isoform X1 [Camelina sativa]
MRWLPQISFSSPSSSPSSSLKPVASYSESPDPDRHHQDRDRFHRRLFRFNRGRLTRQRKLRHLTDDDVLLGERRASTSSSTFDSGLTRSPSAFTAVPRSPSAVPLPLPLPLPEVVAGDSRNRSAGNARGGGGLDERDRDPERVVADRTSSGPPLTSVNGFSRDTRRASENSSNQETSPRNRNGYWVNIPTMSAPTSPHMSPVPSPQRKSTGHDLPFFYLPPKSNQAWSAPDMPLDTSGLPPPAFYDFTAFSTDNSPIHSPQPRSPRRQINRSPQPSRPSSPLHSTVSPDHSAPPRDSVSSPLHPRMSIDVTNGRRDSCNVHPLPLPPGAACPSSAAASVPCPQAPLKQDSFPMNSQWKKGKLIGRGTFGSVYVASNSENGALCAMKEVELFPDDPKSAECIKQLEQEIKLLSNLQHPNIVQYFGSETVEDRFFIYLEYVHPGSINKFIRDHCGGTMTESVVRNFTRHILSGLAYLHSKKTVHRDIKGANLLVDAAGVVKLADFGMAKHLTGQRADLSLKGSPYWMAPELMQAVMQKDSNPDLAFAVDIWSLGCTIIEMFTGKPPWSEFEGAAAMFKVMRDSPPIPESMSPEGKDFLRLCFQRNPAERPTASMLLEHRFLKNSLQPTSPNNNDVSNCSQSFNGMNITEPSSRREKPNFKLDQIPRARNMTSAESESGQQQQQQQYRSPELTGMVSRLSPRSTLEAIPSPSLSQRAKPSSDRRRTCVTSDHL